MPMRLPVSCLTMAPRFDKIPVVAREPLTELNKDLRPGPATSVMPAPGRMTSAVNNGGASSIGGLKKSVSTGTDMGTPADCYLSELLKQLRGVVNSEPALRLPQPMEDEAEDPKCLPMIWISKWVDYSDKYGFGYALSDESIGVLFNDVTKLLMLADGK